MMRRTTNAARAMAGALCLALIGCEEAAGPPAIGQAPVADPAAPQATEPAQVSTVEAPAAKPEDPPPSVETAADTAVKKPRSPRTRTLPTFGDDVPRERAAPARQPLVKKAGQADQITFDTIKFEMEKGGEFQRTMLTEKIEALAGKKVEIRGYILPSFQQEGIKQFVLVRDNMECCFGPGAALYDCVIVDMVPPHTAKYTVRPVTVLGTFGINVLDQDGETLAIYHLDGEAVQ